MNSYAGFNGDIREWYFMAGTGSWSTPDVISCEGPECVAAP